jgi:type II secretory ATPase GspE/PulE/Tfp pilus assembly ATPase PilB-like protein
VSKEISPGSGSDDLLTTFNRHFDDYLVQYGTPRKPRHREDGVEEDGVDLASETQDETSDVEVVDEPTAPEVEPAVEEPVKARPFPGRASHHAEPVVEEPTPEPEVETEVEAEGEGDMFFSPEDNTVDDLSEGVDESESGVGKTPAAENADDMFYYPEEELVAPEPEIPMAPPVAVEPPHDHVVEREIHREVLVVDKEQARDLGYSADKFLADGSQPAEKQPAFDERSNEERMFFGDDVDDAPSPSRSAATKDERRRGGGWLGGFFNRGEKAAPASDDRSAYKETSRYRDENIDDDTIVTGEEEVAPISLKTQDGYDPRAERLRLQHVSTAEKRDVDPTIWLEDTMLEALKLDASDLHIVIDGETRDLYARIRVDGKMRDFDYVQGIPARVIMGRMKAATELSSGGSYAPEETIYTIDLNGEQRKARAVLFRAHDGGEALVMRLPLTGNLKQLDELDFADYNLSLVKDLLAMPYKLIMIAGPMGSGKTTTAHGALLHVSDQSRTVWTIEDPVERRLPNLVQLEVDDENGAGFDVLLSKLLRADYNTLFLGEIRDHDTAAAAVRQAKAGRQVMSTIHADDNIKALMRLIELAGDSALSVLSAVGGVISQRLVRRLNPEWDGVDPDTKYKGRVPVHEITFINDSIIEVMMQGKALSEIKTAVAEAKGSTFSMDAERLIAANITDKEEIVSVVGDYDNL